MTHFFLKVLEPAKMAPPRGGRIQTLERGVAFHTQTMKEDKVLITKIGELLSCLSSSVVVQPSRPSQNSSVLLNMAGLELLAQVDRVRVTFVDKWLSRSFGTD